MERQGHIFPDAGCAIITSFDELPAVLGEKAFSLNAKATRDSKGI